MSKKSKSLRALKNMADDNDVVAMYNLADHYAKSKKGGVAPELKKALYYMQRSSDGGYKKASYRLYRMRAGYAVLTHNFYNSSTDDSGVSIIYISNVNDTAFDKIKEAEKLEIGIDYGKACEYLTLVTNSEDLKADEFSTIDNESQLLIRGKISWAEEYSQEITVGKDIMKAAKLALSISEILAVFVNEHFDKINGLDVDEVSQEKQDDNYFFLESIWRLQRIFFSIYREDDNFISREIIFRGLMFVGMLKVLPDLLNVKAQDAIDKEFESKNDSKPQALYCKATRNNPDGNKKYYKKSNIEVEGLDLGKIYRIKLDNINLYGVYTELSNPPVFLPRQIENEVINCDSIGSLFESEELKKLEGLYLNLFFPNLAFTYHYCLLLTLNNKMKPALELYENMLSSYRQIHRTANKLEQKQHSKLKNLVNTPQTMTFDDYKKDIMAKAMLNDPCYLYDCKKSKKRFDQGLYEKCMFPVNTRNAFYSEDENSSIFDMQPHSKVSINNETLKYIRVLRKGGKFLGFKIHKNKNRADDLSRILVDTLVKEKKAKSDDIISYEDDGEDDGARLIMGMPAIHILYNKGKLFSDPILNQYKVTIPFRELSLGEFDEEARELIINGDIAPQLSMSFTLAGEVDESELIGENDDNENPLKDADKILHIKALKHFIKQQDNVVNMQFNEYYTALLYLGRKHDDPSDFYALSNLLYKEKEYSIKADKLLKAISQMTSEYDYYRGNERVYNKLKYNPYTYPDGLIYPINYDARKKFNQFFLYIKSIERGMQKHKDPFYAYDSFMTFKMADLWKNNNSDIKMWFGSDTFKEIEDSPYQDIDIVSDKNIKIIIEALRNDDAEIDFSKAIEIDSYHKYSKNIKSYLSIATDGMIKIPEMLFMRALLYLNKQVDSAKNEALTQLVKAFYERDLEIEVKQSADASCQDSKPIFKSELYPFLESLKKSGEYAPSESQNANRENLLSSMHYLDHLLLKNSDGEFIYACHMSLVNDAISLKIELEKELYSHLAAEINKKEKELAVQVAKQNAASEKEREMLSFLTHTLRNSLANGPAQLKQSIRLLGTDDYDESNSKYKAINNIVSQLSTFSVVNTLITTFKQYVGDQESFLAQWYEDKQGKADINWVVSFCLRQCISRALFFPNYQRVIKRLIKDDCAAYIKKTRKNYIENILSLNDDDSPTEKISGWMNTYLPKLDVNIDENSPEFAVNNIKYTYLFSIFSEVIWNAFKHTDGEHPISIRWEYNNDHYLFTVENHYIEDEINLESSTNKGLIFIERLLSMFGNASLTYSKDESNTFVASIKLPDNIFS